MTAAMRTISFHAWLQLRKASQLAHLFSSEARVRSVARFRNYSLGSVACVGILLATHRGEFWPFSTFPMFSHAGRPWSRTLVRDVTHASPESWTRELPVGTPFALSAARIEQNDLATLVSGSADRLEPEQWRMLARFFDGPRSQQRLLLYVVTPELDGDLHVSLRYQPLLVIDAGGARRVGASLR